MRNNTLPSAFIQRCLARVLTEPIASWSDWPPWAGAVGGWSVHGNHTRSGAIPVRYTPDSCAWTPSTAQVHISSLPKPCQDCLPCGANTIDRPGVVGRIALDSKPLHLTFLDVLPYEHSIAIFHIICIRIRIRILHPKSKPLINYKYPDCINSNQQNPRCDLALQLRHEVVTISNCLQDESRPQED